jgi:hypothetical protein
LIPIFDPAKDDARIEHWVERVDSLAERYRWDDTIIRLIVSQWYNEQTRYDATWAHIRNDFVAEFRKSVPFSTHRKIFCFTLINVPVFTCGVLFSCTHIHLLLYIKKIYTEHSFTP